MLQDSFWNDREESDKTVLELKNIKNIIERMNYLTKIIDDNLDIVSNANENERDILLLLEEELLKLKKDVYKLELETYLNGVYDNSNAIIEIHAGAGGTESCDWANMLYRMYSRYAQNKGYNLIELDKQDGE